MGSQIQFEQHYTNKLNHKFQSLTIKKQNNVFDLVFAKRLVLDFVVVFVNQIFFIYNYLFLFEKKSIIMKIIKIQKEGSIIHSFDDLIKRLESMKSFDYFSPYIQFHDYQPEPIRTTFKDTTSKEYLDKKSRESIKQKKLRQKFYKR